MSIWQKNDLGNYAKRLTKMPIAYNPLSGNVPSFIISLSNLTYWPQCVIGERVGK